MVRCGDADDLADHVKRAILILVAAMSLAALPAGAVGRGRPTSPTIRLTLHIRHVCRHVRLPRCVHKHIKAKSGTGHSTPPMLEIGDVPGCRDGVDPVPYLQRYHAMLRVIIDPENYALGGISCARAAVASGYRLHLVIQWWNDWSVDQIQGFFRQVLRQLGKVSWAISIGNEQDLAVHGPQESGQQYSAIWTQVEPIVAAAAPHAIRVAGEISPWGFAFIKGAQAYGLPGAQAVSAHPYKFHSCFLLSDFAAWAHEIRLPYWYDEGYLAPGVWLPQKTRTASEVRGAKVVGAWLDLDHPG
jgi:hypothetical protein